MENARTLETEWVLIESAAKSESEDDFLVHSVGQDSDPEIRTIRGAAALLEVLRALAPRRVIFDFQISFQRGLSLLQTLKSLFPELNLIARVRSLRSMCVEPHYFSVQLRSSGVSLHSVGAEAAGATRMDPPVRPVRSAFESEGGT